MAARLLMSLELQYIKSQHCVANSDNHSYCVRSTEAAFLQFFCNFLLICSHSLGEFARAARIAWERVWASGN